MENLKSNIEELKCSTALNKLKRKIPYGWDLNIYRGCGHECKYCYAIYSHKFLGENDFSNYDRKNKMKLLIGIIGVVFVGIVIRFFVRLKRRQDEMEADFQKRFAGKNIRFMDKHALYIARESDGYSHFRGQGYLVLTEDELYFERQLVKKIIEIPTGSIVKVDKARRLAGQGPGMMLKVVFKTQDGEQDAIGWKVKELERWINEISLMAKGESA